MRKRAPKIKGLSAEASASIFALSRLTGLAPHRVMEAAIIRASQPAEITPEQWLAAALCMAAK
jgi:hypothetical protein